jgi:hypothetical protein
MAEPDRPQMIKGRMRFACWVTKATNTHSEYVILTANNGYANAPQCYVILHCQSRCMLHLMVQVVTSGLHGAKHTPLQFRRVSRHPRLNAVRPTFRLSNWISVTDRHICILNLAFWTQQTGLHFSTLHKGHNTLLQTYLCLAFVAKSSTQNVFSINRRASVLYMCVDGSTERLFCTCVLMAL